MTIFDWIIWIQKGLIVAVLVVVAIRIYRGGSAVRERWAIGTIFLVQFGSFVAYYVAWWLRLAHDPMTKYLTWPRSNYLVPHVQTDLTSIGVGWLASGLILLFLGWFFVKRGTGKMLDASDVGQLFLLSVSVGWPTFFIAYAMVFAVAVVLMIGLVLIRKKSIHDRFVITPAIIPSAILTILFQEKLLALTHLAKIGF